MVVKRAFKGRVGGKVTNQRLVAEFELMARIKLGRSPKRICEQTEQFFWILIGKFPNLLGYWVHNTWSD
jgi:hypothetical protein